MKQLDLFSQNPESKPVDEIRHFTLFCDGASRNNPGVAGAGIFIVKNGELFYKQGFFLGIKTNNQAEYLALILGLLVLHENHLPSDTIRIVADSELLVKQLNGIYRIKNSDLFKLSKVAIHLIRKVNAHLVHVLRTENKEADIMANKGIDERRAIPEHFLDYLSAYEIIL